MISSKGQSANLMKIESKRRRNRQEMEEAKQAELNRDNEMRSKNAKIDELELQL